MVIKSKSLITSRYTGTEFKNSSILNNGVTIEDLNHNIYRNIKKNGVRRRKSQARARKSTRF